MSERELDHTDLRDIYDEEQTKRRRDCLCSPVDWPGQCPGPENCPCADLSPADRALVKITRRRFPVTTP